MHKEKGFRILKIVLNLILNKFNWNKYIKTFRGTPYKSSMAFQIHINRCRKLADAPDSFGWLIDGFI